MTPLAAAFLALASAARAADVCPPCIEHPTGEVILKVTAGDVASKTIQMAAMDSTYSRTMGEEPAEDLIARNPAELRNFIVQFARSCIRIKKLFIATHGQPGYISFGGGDLDIDNVGQHLGGLSCAFSPNAEVRFAGCSVGLGCVGEDFVSAAAGHLLSRNGGTLAAERSDQRSLGGLTPNFGFREEHKLRVPAGGGALSWVNRPPVDRGECRNQLASAANYFRARCPSTQAGTIRTLEDALAKFDRVPERFGHTPAHLEAARAYSEALDVAGLQRPNCRER